MSQRKLSYAMRFGRKHVSRPELILVNQGEKEQKEGSNKKPIMVGKIIEYRQSLNKSSNESLASFEKNFLLISGGLLAFSITFIKDLVDIGDTTFLFLLFVGWGLIACSVAVMMFTFIDAAYASIKISEFLTMFIRKKEKNNDTATLNAMEEEALKSGTNEILRNSRVKLKKWRSIAITLFLVGVFAFGTFAGINLYRKNKAAQEEERPKLRIDLSSHVMQQNNISIKLTDSAVIIQGNPSSELKNNSNGNTTRVSFK